MKLLSWNVNGLRAILQKNFLEYLRAADPDILCLQETKCHPADVYGTQWPAHYETHFNAAYKKGYSGTAIFTKNKPIDIRNGINSTDHDGEGRAITAEYENFYLLNIYVPNAQPELARIDFRMSWDRALLAYINKLQEKKPVLICGDLNVAHEEIDLARPKENIGSPGFSDQERDGFRQLLSGANLIDTFRAFDKSPNNYTWWSYRAAARERNIGWRIDYFLTSETLLPKITRAWIEPQIHGAPKNPTVEIPNWQQPHSLGVSDRL